MVQINLVYIDDDPDVDISKYLGKKYEHVDFIINYDEVRFKNEDGYDSLINNPLINKANIVLIDSKLFENDSAITGKFSGEEFKMILRKMFPFIEVLVITQNDLEADYGTIQKYRGNSDKSPEQYYEEKLKVVLNKAIRNINIYRNIANKLKDNEGIDKVLIEKIMNSLDGTTQYEELTTKDIDNIISAFKELQRGLNGERL